MTLEETVDVLAKCAAFDQRTVGTADALAWHEVIGQFDVRDALQAVTSWYTNQADQRARPADIRRAVLAIRAERLKGVRDDELVPDVDPDDVNRYLEVLRARRAAVLDGTPVTDALAITAGTK